jgi:hypothetical protein
MPREETIAESAKQRSLRVPLDHYRRPDRLRGAKWTLSLVAGGIALAYAAWVLLAGKSGHVQTSPGPLAAAHSTWNNDCQVCHKDFQPLRADSLSLTGFFTGQAARRESLDQGCIKCHNTPDHHASAKPDDVPSCAACHHDHLGSAADIIRPADAMCLGCHRENETHRNGPSKLTPAVANVTGFGPVATGDQGPHPDFRSLQSDPGNIKFNHWLHLQPGIAVADAKKKLKLSDLDEADRPQYVAYAKTDDLVQLDCAACHEPEIGTKGSTMRPIAFERHCRACHPLSIQINESQPATKLPHGLTAERLTTVLDGLIVASEQKPREATAATDESGKLPLIPGRTLGSNLAQKINADVLGHRTTMGRAVQAKCQECHELRAPAPETGSGLSDVWAANIPAVWLRHARFDHLAHRHVECRSCHAAAYAFTDHDKPQFLKPPPGQTAARDHEQVMIAGLENCVTCHAPASGTTGGARHDCAECHKYHGGDHALTATPLNALKAKPTIALLAVNSTRLPLAIRPVSLKKQVEATFVGAATCASSGCHGDVHGTATNWKNAFTSFEAEDPHAQAYEVLWTARSREMTRLLERKQTLTDKEHLAALEQRCIGCHATPVPADTISGSEQFAAGVQCESCHGPAGDWLHTHYQTGFRRDSSPGFVDTKNLNERAETCMKCHVGPSEQHGSPQVVDHDLIAAGHPRLAFELRSYFESKPIHWDRNADEARNAGAYGFKLWVAGQRAQAEQRKKLIPANGPVDFAQLDCASCHHDLAARSWRQRPAGDLLKAATAPATRHLAEDAETVPIAERLALAQAILNDPATHHSWDGALQAYLAVRAVISDLKPEAFPQAAAAITSTQQAVENLGLYLARDCFGTDRAGNSWPTQYDSPREYDPRGFVERAQAVNSTLQQLEAAIAAP